MKRLVISFIYLYRWLISPFLPPSCKFTPTCSRYAISAIECHGLPKGMWMTLKRLCKCHPFSKVKTTYDPVIPIKELPPTNSIDSANSTYHQKFKRVHHA
jgi:putative membrane protein insertion efficiency factor